MTNVETRTPEEIESLKKEWYPDPHWDIEATPGFEAHHDELREYRYTCEHEWELRFLTKLDILAEALGCPGNRQLAAYVHNMEYRLGKLEAAVQQ